MTNEIIKSAAEVVSEFLEKQMEDEDVDPGTLNAVISLRDEGKLTKINLLRRLEVLRKAPIKAPADEGSADD